ncbi:STAS/SEC14 domain-containing protein [Polymorphobacter arshaanensis]|uniref:STAS/SEC14 domain-containing protein n=1 Tax=Glacieibacterium arshaanense TaxID=2511025 RepID=A0A4Y9EPS2_9SPHN|nr:STAS/SEC14 domain-containing protein [Polymorphobacter arshaanensis]TFU05596.1 STAS/SEC14 domain-containing protein [Polymorphobacter arshaanensis]
MFTFIEDLPADVLGVEASGPITHEDYQKLIPRVDAMLGKGPIKALYIFNEGVTEFSPQAFWDDQVFTVRHWRDFSHLAIVSDVGWARLATRMFAPLFPAKLKLFRMDQLADAKAWIASAS